MVTYSAAISACEKGQIPSQATHLLQEMSLGGLLPDVIASSAAISACEKGKYRYRSCVCCRQDSSDASCST